MRISAILLCTVFVGACTRAPVTDFACSASAIRNARVVCTFTPARTDKYFVGFSSGAHVGAHCQEGTLCFVEGAVIEPEKQLTATLTLRSSVLASAPVLVDGNLRAVPAAHARRSYDHARVLEVRAAGDMFGDGVNDFAVRVRDEQTKAERIEVFDGKGANLDAVLAGPARVLDAWPATTAPAGAPLGDVTGDGLPERAIVAPGAFGDVLVVEH